MTTTRQGASGDFRAPDSSLAAERGGAGTDERESTTGWQADPPHMSEASSVPRNSRRKRRRQRSQRGKRQRSPQGRGGHVETVNRERIFQDLEGLLRQIREEAEEFSNVTETQINDVAQAVSAFTKTLEGQSDPISERVRSEYQRIREKLVQTLRGER